MEAAGRACCAYYLCYIKFAWSSNGTKIKRQRNLAKHGLDFADVVQLDWANAPILEDARKDYGERRYWAFAGWDVRLYVVTFVHRGEKIRIINFRRANKKEVKQHGKTQIPAAGVRDPG